MAQIGERIGVARIEQRETLAVGVERHRHHGCVLQALAQHFFDRGAFIGDNLAAGFVGFGERL